MESFESQDKLPEAFEKPEVIMAKSGRLVYGCEAFLRPYNQDRILVDLNNDVFAVVDGIGGYDLGDVAAEQVVKAIEQGTKESLTYDQMQIRAMDLMKDAGVEKGGACYVAMKIEKKKFVMWYAGDCQGMIFNQKGEVKLFTRDTNFSLAPRSINPGRVSVEVDEIMNYDRILLASDGLWDSVDQTEVINLIKSMPIDQALRELALLVKKGIKEGFGPRNSMGNPDNLTILLYEILPVPMRSPKY